MLIPFAHDEIELSLGELDIDERKRETVKRQVPRRVPGKFPFVRHRHDTLVVEMTPAGITSLLAFLRRRWLSRVSVEPLFNDVMIKLFVPK